MASARERAPIDFLIWDGNFPSAPPERRPLNIFETGLRNDRSIDRMHHSEAFRADPNLENPFRNADEGGSTVGVCVYVELFQRVLPRVKLDLLAGAVGELIFIL